VGWESGVWGFLFKLVILLKPFDKFVGDRADFSDGHKAMEVENPIGALGVGVVDAGLGAVRVDRAGVVLLQELARGRYFVFGRLLVPNEKLVDESLQGHIVQLCQTKDIFVVKRHVVHSTTVSTVGTLVFGKQLPVEPGDTPINIIGCREAFKIVNKATVLFLLFGSSRCHLSRLEHKDASLFYFAGSSHLASSRLEVTES